MGCESEEVRRRERVDREVALVGVHVGGVWSVWNEKRSRRSGFLKQEELRTFEERSHAVSSDCQHF